MNLRTTTTSDLAPLAIVLLLGATLSAGCGGLPHQTVWEEHAPLAQTAAQRVSLPPEYAGLTIGSLTIETAPDADPESALTVPVDLARETLRDLLRCGDGIGTVALREDKGSKGLVLDTTLRAVHLRRDALDDSTALSVAAYVFGGFLANWYHDSTYALTLAPEFRVRDPLSGELLLTVPGSEIITRAPLSFVERRPGPGPFLATVAWAPQLAFDSEPGAVARWLLPVSLAAPSRELIGRLSTLRVHFELEVERIEDLPKGFSLKFRPLETAGPVELALSVRPGSGRVAAILVGETRKAVRG
ncbi:MAG: hypothetical protein ACYTFT_11010, partial [Planctomycetota bacterium]